MQNYITLLESTSILSENEAFVHRVEQAGTELASLSALRFRASLCCKTNIS